MNEVNEAAILAIKKQIITREELKNGWKLIEVKKRPNCSDIYLATIRKFSQVSTHTIEIVLIDNGDDFIYIKDMDLIA